ncbi:hypothetical protein DM02DRAFT_685668 [Periconia macrospinosa]|uniref:BTB domain-containing protein n=1 Tax=Periconia macrospinosa TaxID=97972 RepID=A0A2V1CWJ9_9PLEO|nr:hypothetical protein DM02DRAFT_685668 [Periconia macrospinosa]
MAATFKDFIQSCQFTFFIGKEGKPIVVYAAAIAATSQQLDALTNGGMEESGWFSPAGKAKRKSKKGKVAEISEAQEATAETGHSEESQVRHFSRTQLRTQFNSREYLSKNGPKALILQHFEPKPNNAVNQNFTPVFLAHARLSCSAHLHLIAPLKALTLEKLHKTLMGFRLYTKRIGDLVELARYAYANPDLSDRSSDDTIDELRKLIVEYIVCETDIIGRRNEFVNYMEEGGKFVGDFWTITTDYMS